MAAPIAVKENKSAGMESKGMQFAKLQLEKFGWKEGSGLGRFNNGITEALRPKLKFDSTGLGHSHSEQFTYHWWDHAFNKAAKSFDVVTGEEGALVVVTGSVGHLSSKKSALEDGHSLAYGVFKKAGTLKNGDMVDSKPPVVEEAVRDFSIRLSDEKLFELCGGRTAHKGARHGHRCEGKLARVAKQEALLLAKLNGSDISATSSPALTAAVNLQPKDKIKKKKKKKSVDEGGDCDASSIDVVQVEEVVTMKRKHVGEEKTTDLIDHLQPGVEVRSESKKRKKKKHCDQDSSAAIEVGSGEKQVTEEQPQIVKKKKKRKKDLLDSAAPLVESYQVQVAEDTESGEIRKKKKKKKSRDL